jgi:hypothetical protein
MRGSDAMTGSLFSYVDIEARIPSGHLNYPAHCQRGACEP